MHNLILIDNRNSKIEISNRNSRYLGCKMEKKEKIRLLEEIMELENGTLTEDAILEDFEEWDSLTVISFLALMDTRFHKNIPVEQIKQFVTVADAINAMK